MTTPPRPTGVTLTTLLLALCLLTETTTLIRSQLILYREFPKLPWTALYAVGFYLLYKAGEAAVLVFFWRGRDWALWSVLTAATFTLAGLCLQVKTIWSIPPHLEPITIVEIALAPIVLVYGNLRSTRAWFH